MGASRRRIARVGSSNIAPVALDTTGSVLSTIDQGARMTVLGAGKTHGRYTYSPSQWNAALPDELPSVEVGRVPVQHCVDQLPGLLNSGHLDGNMICSVSLNRLDKNEELGTACHGDSGGPLIVSRPKEPSISTTSSTTNLRQHPTSSATSSNSTSATATSTSNQDILLGVVSVGKQNCNGEATAYTSVSYASAWMCSILCQDSLGLVAFEDCPDWCYDEENGRYHGEVMSDGNGGSPIFGFTGDSQDGNGGGGTAYGLKEQQGRAHAFIDEDESNNQITSANGNSINCETEGNLEFLFRSKSKSCRVSGMICVFFICLVRRCRSICLTNFHSTSFSPFACYIFQPNSGSENRTVLRSGFCAFAPKPTPRTFAPEPAELGATAASFRREISSSSARTRMQTDKASNEERNEASVCYTRRMYALDLVTIVH